jgi:fucose 4-O-acetylase-like acetyltransferase
LYLVKSDKCRILTSILLASPALFFFSHTITPFFFAPAFAALIFYSAGYLAKKYDLITQSNFLVLFVACFIYAFVCSFLDVLGWFDVLGIDHPVTWYIGTLAGSVFLSKVLYHLYTHNITSKFVEYLGKNSLFIMLVNIPVLFSLQTLIGQSQLPIFAYRVLSFGLTMITIVGMLQVKYTFKQRKKAVHSEHKLF